MLILQIIICLYRSKTWMLTTVMKGQCRTVRDRKGKHKQTAHQWGTLAVLWGHPADKEFHQKLKANAVIKSFIYCCFMLHV